VRHSVFDSINKTFTLQPAFYNSSTHCEDVKEGLAATEKRLDGTQFSLTVSSEEGKVDF